jgi:nucleoside-diphosphate kinase
MTDADNRSVRNLVHASGSPKEADDEISHWFAPDELIKYKLVHEHILYSQDMDGLLG